MSTSATPPPSRGRVHRSLGFYLGLSGLVILLPALVFGGFLIWQFTTSSREATERRVFDMADALVQDVDQGIVEMITALRILSRSQELDRKDLTGFHKRVQEALWATHLHVVLVDRDFRQLLNTRVTFGAPLGRMSDIETARRAIATKQVAVSNLFFGKVAEKYVFNVVMPIVRKDKVVYLLIMTRDADTMISVLHKQRLPPGWTATILDRKGIVIARSADNAAVAGKRTPLGRLVPGGASGVRTVIRREGGGASTLHAVGRSAISGWHLVASVPLTVIEAPLRRSWTMFAIVGGILVGFSLLFVVFMARQMSMSMRWLAREAEKLGRSEPVVPRRFAMRETNDVSLALESAYQELRARTIALRESEEHLRLSTEAAELGTWERNLDTGQIKTTPEYRRMLGLDEDEALSTTDDMRKNVPSEDRKRIRESIEDTIATGEPYEVEYRVNMPDGEEKWLLSRGRLSVDEDTGRRRILSVSFEITERKEREARLAFLMREMSHRAKNLLSVIQAMASQTGRTSADLGEFQQRFAERLQSLARSNDLLIRENWQGATIEDLIRSQLSSFLDIEDGQLRMSGERLMLSSQATQTLGLALHELATNASKYGALSVPEGMVEVKWRVEDRDGVPRFILSWAESGGPAVAPPTRRGFGRIVIERLAAQTLEAEVDIDFAATGFRWTLDGPLDAATGSKSATSRPA